MSGRLLYWGIRDSFFAIALRDVTCEPSTESVPPSGFKIPETSFKSVVFPLPLAPMIP